ncbi:MAG: sporulation integral membrane protein YtvI [Clostridia bacterium]|nr:sporulation integral membrane protein YtvI [Clostridia bacterium]
MTTEKKRDFLINAAYTVVILVIVYLLLTYAIKWIMPVIIAFIVSALLYPVIRFVSKKLKLDKHKRPVAAVITALFFCTVGVLVGFIISKLVVAVTGLIMSFPEYFSNTIYPNLTVAYEKTRDFLSNLHIEIDTGSKTFFDSIMSTVSGIVSEFTPSLSFVTSIPGMLLSILIMIISTFFISMDFDTITDFCLAQLPKKTADFVVELKDYTVKVLFKYGRSYALILTITFTELLIGFAVMHFVTGLQNIFLLALLIAVMDILPIVGTGTALIPWAIISFIIGDYLSGICLLVIYVIITVIRQIIEPKIVGKQVGLHPIVTLVAMIVGTKLFGGIGLLGLPITLAIIKDLNDHGKIHIFKPLSAYKPAEEEKKEEEKPEDGTPPGDGAENDGKED